MAKPIALTTVKIPTSSVNKVKKNKKATGIGIGRFYQLAADKELDLQKQLKPENNA